MIPHNKPTVGKEEARAAEKTIKNGWIAQGRKVEEFENALCRFVGLPEGNAVALSSGTSSLFVALKVLGIGSASNVIVPTYACSAVMNAVYMAGARPLPADIDTRDFNISFEGIRRMITPKTKAIIVTHTFGVPVDVKRLQKLGISVIEDCATALGSKIGHQHPGSFGDCAILSFYASKVITTGQGGMFISKKQNLVSRARDYRNFDYVRKYYPRFNLQMTDIQGAMGIVQLSKLHSFLKARSRIAEIYSDLCFKKGWDFQRPVDEHLHQNWYRFVIKTDTKTIRGLKEYLGDKNIRTIIPMETWELLHNYLKLNPRDFTNSETVSRTTLSLPIYPSLILTGGLEKVMKALNTF